MRAPHFELSVKRNGLEKVDQLEEILEYHFRDQGLLTQAMTHRSWAHEQVSPRAGAHARNLHNEALEFLGDSILGLIVAEYLSLGEFVRFGRGEEKSGGRRKHALLADIFEAVTGAIFLDGGLEAARQFIERALGEELRAADPIAAAAADPKTMLQEKLQATHQPGPQYTVVETLGPPHKRMFHVELKWDGGTTRGEGQTIKAAETAAAQEALKQMESEALS